MVGLVDMISEAATFFSDRPGEFLGKCQALMPSLEPRGTGVWREGTLSTRLSQTSRSNPHRPLLQDHRNDADLLDTDLKEDRYLVRHEISPIQLP